MRQKIVKRVKHKLRQLGADRFDILDTTGWYDPKCYGLNVHYQGRILGVAGDDELKAYKYALKLLQLEKQIALVTRGNLWDDRLEKNDVVKRIVY